MPTQIKLDKLDQSIVIDLHNPRGDLAEMASHNSEAKFRNNEEDTGSFPEHESSDVKDSTNDVIPEADNSNEAVESKESFEGKELSEREINEKQCAAIKDALERFYHGEDLTEKEKGNLCEMMMDQYYISQGYSPLHAPRITSLDDKGHQGIDGVYQKGDQFVVSDAKYDQAQQKDTLDGRQMSDTWIDRRLDESVGKEKAEEIRDAEEDGRVSHEIYHYDPNPDESGITSSDIHSVDENGNSNRDKHEVERYKNGERLDTTNGGENGA